MSTTTAGVTRAWLLRGGLSLLALGAVAVVAIALQRGSAAEQGPRPIVWGKQPCAHCRMLIGEPRHAAQVVLRDGSAKSFDDPGCLLRYVDESREEIAESYFHHGQEQRWLRAPAVAFVRGGQTPMGFGLIATDPGTEGALSLAEAAAEVRARRARAAGAGH